MIYMIPNCYCNNRRRRRNDCISDSNTVPCNGAAAADDDVLLDLQHRIIIIPYKQQNDMKSTQKQLIPVLPQLSFLYVLYFIVLTFVTNNNCEAFITIHRQPFTAVGSTTMLRSQIISSQPINITNVYDNNLKLLNIDNTIDDTINNANVMSNNNNDNTTTTMNLQSDSNTHETNTNKNRVQSNNNNNNKVVGCITGVIQKAGPLNEAVLSILRNAIGYDHYTLQDANELITIGAIWAKMETLTSNDILSLYDSDTIEYDARMMYADLPKGWGSGDSSQDTTMNDVEDDLDAYIQAMEDIRYRRILSPSWMDAGIDIRIYPKPRRFPICYTMSRSQNLLYEDTTFIVVDKPPMLPTQPDASNYIECCPACVNDMIGPFYDIVQQQVQRPLLCHRVDTCVGGCVVLSKDRNGQRVFHELQRQRKIRKMYLAVTTQLVPVGQHIHWMWSKQSSRNNINHIGPPCQLVRHTPPESRRKARTYWNRCILEVVSCEPITIPNDLLHHDSLNHTNDPNSQPQHQPEQYYQSTIRLVTGRKHQVRAQLASLGCPILYDTLYTPISGYTLDTLEDTEHDFEEKISNCRVPTQPIGLQAAGILFGGIKVRAKSPWWVSK